MLRPACRRFRAGFRPGESSHPGREDEHRRSCPACASHASAMERAAFRVPLPARLRSRLRAIPGTTAGADPGPRLPLPRAPLPAPLRDRLRGLAGGPAPRSLPAWVRTSRHAVAASYLMAVLVGLAAGDPLHLGREAAGRMSEALFATLAESRDRLAESRAHLGEGRERWEEAVRERVGETRRSLEDSLGILDDRVDELSQSLRSLEPLITRRVR